MVTVMKTEAMGGDWVGQVIDGRFALLKWLGGSDASSVFLTQFEGEQPQKAAIRLIPAEARDADAQIAQWKAATALSHPHLMRLFDTGSCHVGGDRFFYSVTEYAEENLSEILPVRALTTAETREMLDPVLDAFGYLHAKGLVHGRVKPSTIMVVNDQVKLSCDSVQVAGKPGRQTQGVEAAPECAAGTISPAADIWSLGVTLVEALTQRPPVWDRATKADPVVPESLQQPFADIARECLRIDPARRCTLSDIRGFLEPAQSSQSQSIQRSTGKSDKAIPAKLLRPVLIAAALGVIAAIAVILLPSHKSPSLPPPAVVQQSEPATAAPPAPAPERQSSPLPETQSSPTPERPSSEGARLNGEVAERVLPELLPKAVASIHGLVNVKVRVTVDATGAVSSAEFDSPGPSKYFAKSALEAARGWKFKPAEAKGVAAASTWVIEFRFKRDGTEVNPVEVAP
jgi:TonB family protein